MGCCFSAPDGAHDAMSKSRHPARASHPMPPFDDATVKCPPGARPFVAPGY